MKQKEMIRVAGWISEVLTEINHYRLPSDKKDRKTYLAEFRSEVNQNRKIKQIKMEIKQFNRSFPIFCW